MVLSPQFVGNARDVVAVDIESDVMGSDCSCDVMIGGNESMTISIISIMIIIVLISLLLLLLLLLLHWENVYRKIIGMYRNFDAK